MMAKNGAKLPALESMITPQPHLLFIWNAFSKLSTERTFGMGPGPIPVVSVIERYGRDHGVVHLDRFVHLVREMDSAWLHHTNEVKAAGKPPA
jgi:hypothetical protein